MTAAEAIDQSGWMVLPELVTGVALRRLQTETAGLLPKAGMRGVLELDWARDLVVSGAVEGALKELRMPCAGCVRGLLFDKHEAANWSVPWHQDRNIAVRGRSEAPGFRAWSVKDGVPHCQPPVEVLERMVTLRLHLDDCGPDNGPLRILPATHKSGFLTINASVRAAEAGVEQVATCSAGDCIVMRPLVLHASSKATEVGHRRVVHLEFAPGPLPGGVEWNWFVRP